MSTAMYRLQPYGDPYPRGTLAVTELADPSKGGRVRYACSIAWTEAEGERPRIVYDETVSSGVGAPRGQHDQIAATALTFATYWEYSVDGPYTCNPLAAWGEWNAQHGEHVGLLRWHTVDSDGNDLRHLRI